MNSSDVQNKNHNNSGTNVICITKFAYFKVRYNNIHYNTLDVSAAFLNGKFK